MIAQKKAENWESGADQSADKAYPDFLNM